jgi:hypothetical protein
MKEGFRREKKNVSMEINLLHDVFFTFIYSLSFLKQNAFIFTDIAIFTRIGVLYNKDIRVVF